jgi:hypothetical protein
MALTGYTRSGQCYAHDDDHGSHHVCIDLSSTTGGNFCSVTVSSRPSSSSSSSPLLPAYHNLLFTPRAGPAQLVLVAHAVRRRPAAAVPRHAVVRLPVGVRILR